MGRKSETYQFYNPRIRKWVKAKDGKIVAIKNDNGPYKNITKR